MNTAFPTTRLFDATPPTPWKNGRGVTRELFAWPSGAAWFVRVSVADIDESGMFSAFPGVERYFAVLEGEGVELEGVGVIRAGDEAMKFDGDRARYCRLLDGKTRDLNVMIRRDAGYGVLRVVREKDDLTLAPGAAVHGLLSWPEGTLTIDVGNNELATHARPSGDCDALYYFAFWRHGAVIE